MPTLFCTAVAVPKRSPEKETMLYILPFEDLPQNPTPNNPIKFKCLQMRVINPDSPELLPLEDILYSLCIRREKINKVNSNQTSL